MAQPLKPLVLAAAKKLFLAHGYDAVGMREIAEAVDRNPVQIYRLNLSKSDILAELMFELNHEQIVELPRLCSRIKDGPLVEMVCAYLHQLYMLDINHLPIRSVGTAYGWIWHAAYENKIVGQVIQLLLPVTTWMAEAGLDEINARGYGIWSVYYVGFRRAAIHGGSADDCIREIRPTLELFLRDNSDSPRN